jgi:hypothetical protein
MTANQIARARLKVEDMHKPYQVRIYDIHPEKWRGCRTTLVSVIYYITNCPSVAISQQHKVLIAL